MLESFVQLRKASLPIEVTLAGIVMLERLGQKLNASLPIEVTLLDIVMLLRLEQLTKALSPIEVTFNDDNTIDFSLKNFGLDLGGTYANVGNVTVPGLGINNQGIFSFDGNIQITAGDKEGVELWLGPTLGDIPVVLNGTIKGDKENS